MLLSQTQTDQKMDEKMKELQINQNRVVFCNPFGKVTFYYVEMLQDTLLQIPQFERG